MPNLDQPPRVTDGNNIPMEDFEDVCRRVTAAFKAGRNCDPFIFGLAADAKPQYRELIERSYELGKQKTNENAEVMFVCVVLLIVFGLGVGVAVSMLW